MTGRVTFTEDARRDLDELAQQDRRLAVQALRTAARLGRGGIRGKTLGDFVKTGDLRDCHSLYFGAAEEEDTHRLVLGSMRVRTRLAPALLTVALALVACEAPAPDEPAAPADPETPEPAGPTPAGPTPAEPTPADPTPDETAPDDPDEPEEPPARDEPDLDAVQVTLTEVATADAPTDGTVGPDGGLWITERPGRVRVLGDDGLGEPVIDLSADTTTDAERGLLGLAFAEDFTHLYVSYTNRDGDTRVDEYEMDGDRPDEATRRTVFGQEQPYANHNGGGIVVGPDGYLYLGLGDGGSAGDPLEAGQDIGTPLGALLRIDPRGGDPYAVPDDNPFVDVDDAAPEVWAYGLRNPWRFSFDAEAGDLWIADVGQADREEVNWVPADEGAGANYGWNLMEGTMPFAGEEPDDHVPPVFEYDTTGRRCAITGGFVYRGEAIPELRGAYLFSDYCEGVVRAIHVRDGETVAEADLGVDAGQAVSFVEDAERELYVLDLGGAIFRLDPA